MEENIMNKIVEAVVKGQEVDKKELFNSINDFELTRLRVSTEDGQTIMSMQVNSCKEHKDAYEFSQSCTMFNDVVYSLKKDSIEAIESEYNTEVDTLYITCKLKNSQSLTLMVINTDEVLTKDYDEMDVYQLKDFLEAVIHEKNEYYCACARISDLFGFDLKMRNTFRTYINTLDEDDWKLHISDDFTELEISVTDDSINEFYVKDNKELGAKEIIVKPFNQPYMEITMLFLKKHNK